MAGGKRVQKGCHVFKVIKNVIFKNIKEMGKGSLPEGIAKR